MEILKGLRNDAIEFENEKFEKESSYKDTMAIAIINVGHCLDPLNNFGAKILKKHNIQRPP